MVTPGTMDRRITFQTFTETQDGFGYPVKTYNNLPTAPTVWAEVTPFGLGRESILATKTLRFRVRWRDDLSVEHRIFFQGERFDIRSISEIGRREGLEILAEKVAT